jgi:hypothetical protein
MNPSRRGDSVIWYRVFLMWGVLASAASVMSACGDPGTPADQVEVPGYHSERRIGDYCPDAMTLGHNPVCYQVSLTGTTDPDELALVVEDLRRRYHGPAPEDSIYASFEGSLTGIYVEDNMNVKDVMAAAKPYYSDEKLKKPHVYFGGHVYIFTEDVHFPYDP